jgi:hypothetical protein
MGLGKQEGVDNGELCRSDGPCEGPVDFRSLWHISEARDLSISLNPKVLGKVEVLLVFVIDGILGLKLWLDNREGPNCKGLFECQFA